MPEPVLPMLKEHRGEESREPFTEPKPTPPSAGYAESVAAKVDSSRDEVRRAFHPPMSKTFIHAAPPPYYQVATGGKK